ncbi:hypothetical protein COOONC_16858 [Cooperia oncophora]
MAHCNIEKNQCNLTHGTVIWSSSPTTSICRYVKATEGVAYVTPTHIVLNNIQSAFTYKNVTFSHSQLNTWCLNNSAIPMDNGVFIVLPEIKDHSPQSLFSQHPEIAESINPKQQNLNPSQKREHELPIDKPDKNPEAHLSLPLLYKLIHKMQKRSLHNQDPSHTPTTDMSTHSIKSIAQINPTTAARILLNREDYFRFVCRRRTNGLQMQKKLWLMKLFLTIKSKELVIFLHLSDLENSSTLSNQALVILLKPAHKQTVDIYHLAFTMMETISTNHLRVTPSDQYSIKST